MKVLKANTKEYDNLNGFKNGNHILQFEKDANNNWIVGIQVLNFNHFLEIRNKLQKLKKIDYNPIKEEII
jgi:hypothetical protein|tara:strand:+ start:771 stop:980 length:210 start_codon:yes stop_codon:yes gene_type:complete